ncbi:circadian clock-controlled protein daywake [Drosophila grimshawi]|uniref:GH12677 n=1 Tax=Drosophila grimshawi TaxID=7222 RepID=B4JKJ8_DROGR|nr:circadian clock-controlled protein daywake [Drosophila grimshawi]EDW00101.1 GH12677 [Drosophila grimshawi]
MFSGNWIFVASGLILLMGSPGARADHFPAPLKRCRIEDEACHVKQAQAFVDTFKHGIPERNVAPIEIIELGTLRSNSGDPGSSLQFNLVMSNTTLHNFADTLRFKSVTGFTKDLTKPMKLSWTFSTDYCDVHANYDVNGKILLLSIVSQGEITVKLKQLQCKTRLTAVPEKRDDGNTYLKITDFNTAVKVGSGHIDMTNLFKDNVELSESTLQVVNDEYDVIAKEVHPQIMIATDRVLKKVIQNLWDTIPYEEFFDN